MFTTTAPASAGTAVVGIVNARDCPAVIGCALTTRIGVGTA